jgi:hypothetical protein
MKHGSSLALPVFLAGLLQWVPSSAHAYTINTTEVGKRIRWSVDTVHLQIASEFETFLEPGQAHSALAMGVDAWRGLPRVPDLLIESGAPESLGHHDGRSTNGVYLLRDWPYEATKLAVTVVTYEMDTGRLLDADIVVNGKANFALLSEPVMPGSNSYDLAGVLTHEAGHVLGLGESNEGEDATMWPYARPDDTEKRTLASDDEDGVIESYLSSPPVAANGCGSNSVGGRTSGRGGVIVTLWVVAMVLMFRMANDQRRRVAVVAGCALCTLTVGFDDTPADSESSESKILLTERLALSGTRADRANLELLASDSDNEVARRAQFALGRALARPAVMRLSANTASSKARLNHLFGTSAQRHVGRTAIVGTVEHSGLLFTEYQVRTSTGERVALRVAGGSRDGIAQRVIDVEPPPAADQEVIVAPQADGTQRWAYHQNGVLFGGDLGDDAPIDDAI